MLSQTSNSKNKKYTNYLRKLKYPITFSCVIKLCKISLHCTLGIDMDFLLFTCLKENEEYKTQYHIHSFVSLVYFTMYTNSIQCSYNVSFLYCQIMYKAINNCKCYYVPTIYAANVIHFVYKICSSDVSRTMLPRDICGTFNVSTFYPSCCYCFCLNARYIRTMSTQINAQIS